MKKLLALLALLPLSLIGASVGLQWDPNSESDLAGYRLYQGTNSGSYTKTVDILAPKTTVVASNLIEGVEYFWVVTAFNTSGLESEPSNEVRFGVPVVEAATKPEGLVAIRDASKTVIQWLRNNPGQKIIRYEVYWLPVGKTEWQTDSVTDTYFAIPISGRVPMAVKVIAVGPKGSGPAASLVLEGLKSPAFLRVDEDSISYIE